MDSSDDRYGTEKAVGKAIRESGVARNQLFITTKLWNNKHHPDDVPKALDDSLNDLGLEYIDLYLMHWPVAWKRGDDLFPKDNGNFVMENIDIVDVSWHVPAIQSSLFKLNDFLDLQSNGKASRNWQSQGNWRVQLLQGGDGAYTKEHNRGSCGSSNGMPPVAAAAGIH